MNLLEIRKHFGVIVVLSSVAFTISTMIQTINLPGMYYDDAYFGRLSMYMLQNFPAEKYAFDTITIFGRTLPTYVWYQGALTSYLYLPLFAVFDINNYSMRLLGVIINIATIFSTYFFSKELFNRKVAILSTIFLATTPAFLFYGKFPGWTSTELFLFFISSLYFLVKWKKTDKTSYLVIATFLMGLGISVKLIFLWALIGFFIFFIVYKQWKKLSFRKILFSIISFGGGSILFLIYIAKSGISFLQVILAGSSKTWYGAVNTDFLSNLILRINQFNEILSGSSLTMLGGQHGSQFVPWLFVISIIGFILFGKYRNLPSLKKGIFIISIFSIVLVLSSFTLSVFNPAQLLILLPLPLIIIALFLYTMIKSTEKWKRVNKFSMVGCVIISVAIIFTNLAVVMEYHNTLEKVGGRGNFSDQIDNLSYFLLENQYYRPVALDWGFANSIYVITNGKVVPAEIFGYPDLKGNTDLDKFVSMLKDSFNEPHTVYLIHSPNQPTMFDRRDLFIETVESSGKKLVLLKEFYQGDGQAVFQVYKIE